MKKVNYDPDFIQSEILIDFVMKKIGKAKISEYEKMFDWIRIIINSRKLDLLDKYFKFAIAVLIVGLKKTDYFWDTFKILWL